MKRIKILAALGAALVASLAATAGPAEAAVVSASIDGGTATLDLDGADDNVTVSVSGGLLVHGQTTGGLNSGSDWDSATAGDQTVPADGTFGVLINGGGGNDALTVLAKNTETDGAKIAGDGGDDLVTGADSDDSLVGGDGNDRLVGARGADTMSGGEGNDVLIWNQGDGNDVVDGDGGNDETVVNGAPTAGDQFTIKPQGNRVRFDRVNLGLFFIDLTSERLTVNGLGGNDTMTADPGLAALIALTLRGDQGTDTITGGDGADRIFGGDDVDTLTGGGGRDELFGDRANDVVSGGAGDDALVWNNGDGSDKNDGQDGFDTIEVNGQRRAMSSPSPRLRLAGSASTAPTWCRSSSTSRRARSRGERPRRRRSVQRPARDRPGDDHQGQRGR